MNNLFDAPAEFRKKPVVISAMIWNGHNINAVNAFAALNRVKKIGDRLRIQTREGAMYAAPGDFIIRGVAGELYPCGPEIFAATYEAVALPRVELPWKGPGDKPHRYSPDYMAQGDCQSCGHTRDAHDE